MRTTTVWAERDIAALADRLYRIIADYRNHHPHILPPAFTDLVVEHGGIGEGTVIRFTVKDRGASAGDSAAHRGAGARPRAGRAGHEP